jgi:hypothetical protein
MEIQVQVGEDVRTVRFKNESDFDSVANGICSESLLKDCVTRVVHQLSEGYLRTLGAREAAAPPKTIPEELWEEFTDGGSTPVLDWYRDDSYAEYYKHFPRYLVSFPAWRMRLMLR